MPTSMRPAPPRMSAVPRWSHRDPVEGSNPFSPGDPRCSAWARATTAARTALARNDDALAASVPVARDPQTYGQRLIELATTRFDTWAQRGLAAVDGRGARRDYETWLQAYIANWRAYVADTCPHVTAAVREQIHASLTSRAKHWAAEALRAPGRHDGAGSGAA